MDIADGSRADDRAFAETPPSLRRYVSRWRFIACVQALDFSVLFLLYIFLFRTLYYSRIEYGWSLHVGLALLATAMIHCVFHTFGIYDLAALTRGPEAALRVFAVGCLSFGPYLVPLLIREDVDSTTSSGTAMIAVGLASLAIAQFGIAYLATNLQRSGLICRRIYIIAHSTTSGTCLKDTLERLPDNRVVGTLILSALANPMEEALEGALDFLRGNPVDLVILNIPMSPPDRLVSAARVLRSLPQTVLLAPTLDAGENIILYPNKSGPDGLGNIVLVKLSERPLDGWRWVLKDVQDRTLALLLLAFVAPVMLAIALAIKLCDPGPVFFRQERRGYGGNTFEIVKFRTMRAVRTQPDPAAFKLTTRNDPRVFPVGGFLRRTSLDELPQLLNVIKGDMWIIGPRPHPLLARAGGIVYPDAVQEYAARYRIKPGITGWAQVCGWRGPTDTLEQLSNRVEHDLYYIENWSTSFDAAILLKTLFCAFSHDNAF